MPVIVLLTDFGAKDYFAGVMKGVISGINSVSRVVDLTHEIEPHNVRQAAFVLWASRKFFPEGSIFVNVVDPGVGSTRKIICGVLDNQIFLAPDNGLLDYVVAETNGAEFYEVTNQKFFLQSMSATFHGRDIFAPVAAHISRGIKLSDLGNKFKYPEVKSFYKEIGKGKNDGEVVYQDHFGNAFTTFLWDDSLLAGKASLKISSKIITKFLRSYSEGEGKIPFCVKGSSGLIEIAVNRDNASKILKSKIGQKITLVLS